MFAPKPFDLDKEMVRVTKPGGRIVMGNWIPNDPTFVAQVLKISSAFTPQPPEGFISPMTRGVNSTCSIALAKRSSRGKDLPGERHLYLQRPRQNSPASRTIQTILLPTMNAYDAADKKTSQPAPGLGRILQPGYFSMGDVS
jgi:hypothetical protein